MMSLPKSIRLWILYVSILAVIWNTHPVLANPRPPLDSKKVLILHDLEFNVPILVETNRGLMKALDSGGVNIRNQFYENLDFGRNPGVEHRKKIAELLRHRYGNSQIDLIITTYAGALNFVLNEGRTIFNSQAPIIALYLAPGLQIPESDRFIFRHSTKVDPLGTLEGALNLLPKTKRVYVVSGVHINDKRLERLVREQFQKWEGRLEFIYLSDMSLDAMLKKLSHLPEQSIVLLTAFQTDTDGKVFTTREVVQKISQNSNAPLFGLVDVGFGHGLVGGNLFSYEVMGRKAGELGLEILERGIQDAPGSRRNLEVDPVPMYDARQMKRWGLNPRALPQNSIVLNKELELWDLRYYILGAVLFGLAETALIVFLIVQRQRKKVAEESLRTAEEKYRRIFEGALEGIYESLEGPLSINDRPAGMMPEATFNPAIARMLGYDSVDELRSFVRDVSQVWVNLDDRTKMGQLLEEQQAVRGFESQFWRKDRTKIWVAISTQRICGPDGKTIGYSGFIEDITERRRGQEAVRKSEAKYRQLHESMMDGYVFVDMDGLIKEYNETFLNLTGYGAEELPRLTYRDLTPEKWHEFERKIVEEQVLIRGYSDIYEKEYRRKDGTVFPIELRTVLLKDETGANSGMWAIIRDITGRKGAEQALRESEERFRQVAENVVDFIWEIDAEGVYRYTSPPVERIVGYTPEELIGKKHFYDLFAPEVREELKKGAFKVFAARESFRAFPNPNLSKQGKIIYLETSGVPVLDSEGNLIGYRGADTDVTERNHAEQALRKAHEELQQEMGKREKAEQQLLQAQKLESIGTLTGGIAHDFNNILHAVGINAELALLDLPGGLSVRNNVDLILKSALRGKDLVKQMLLFSRKSGEKQEAIITLTPLMKETLKLLRASLPATIEMNLLLETESDAVWANASQIQQVIMNLCTNAAYAMRGMTGSINILLQASTFGANDLPEAEMQPGAYLVLSIKDTGSGMDEEVKKRIFEPFFTTKPAGEGTGLGLSVVYGIVKSHKGSITVSSEPGKGSIFTIYLPKADTGAPEKLETFNPIRKGNERILLIDDEEIIVNSVRNTLERVGYKVTAVTDSQRAIILFSADPAQFDLVMTDQTMPNMTGESLGKDMMRIRPDIPIILCTGYSDSISPEKVREMGFQGFLMKPFTMAEGAELVRYVLDRNIAGKGSAAPFVSRGSERVDLEKTRNEASVAPADLCLLPIEWLKKVSQIVKEGRSKELFEVIDEIRSLDGNLAGHLAELVAFMNLRSLLQ